MKTTSASSKGGWNGFVRQAIGLFVLPGIPLSILAYRLMGRPYVYHLGDPEVRPASGRLTPNQLLFYRAFPMLVVLAIYAVLALVMWLLGQPVPFI